MYTLMLGLLLMTGPTEAQGPSGRPTIGAGAKKAPARGKRGKSGKSGKRGKRGKSGKSGKSGKAAPSSTGGSMTEMWETNAKIGVLITRRRYRQAMIETTKALVDDPTNPVLHAARAVCCSQYGDYHCTVGSLEDAYGTETMQVLRVVAEADSLRFLGRPEAAAKVRREIIVDHSRPKREVTMLVHEFEDHEVADDLEAMWDVAWEAAALEPDSPLANSLLARVYAASGDFETAKSYLWLAERHASKSATLAIAVADIYRAFDEPIAAAMSTDENRTHTLRSKTYTVARARALIASGDYDNAINLLDVRSWYLADELWHPDLIAVQGMAYSGAGLHEYALAIADRLAATYPDHPPAQHAVQAIRKRSGGAD